MAIMRKMIVWKCLISVMAACALANGHAAAVNDGIDVVIFARPVSKNDRLFFVSPRAARLHLRISAGMEAMLKDGSLERLVLAHHKEDLRRAKLCGRKRLELPNRQLESSMFARKELWFNPFEARHGLCPALLPR